MTQAAHTAQRSRWPGAVGWGMTMVALVAVAWFTTDLLRRCTPSEMAEGAGRGAAALVTSLKDALKPSVVVNPVAVLRGEDDSPRLVVWTQTLDVTVPLAEEAWYGDTYSQVVARNCRVQFVIPLDRMTDRDLLVTPGSDGEPARMVVLAPRPRLDTQMLVIAPESLEFTERRTGLNYVTGLFGGMDRDRLVKLLRPQLLEAGSAPALRKRAEAAAREFFEKRLAEMLRSDLRMGRDVVVDVRWVEE